MKLPEVVRCVTEARKLLRTHYANHELKNDKRLQFTFDGKFVGDLGEAIAAEMFNLELDPGKYIDGYTRCNDRKPVQIKATGRAKGTFQFRNTKYADHGKVHLIAIRIDWDACEFDVVYNGPESNVRPKWVDGEFSAKLVTVEQMIRADGNVHQNDKLVPHLILLPLDADRLPADSDK